jgi:acyl carrier protein
MSREEVRQTIAKALSKIAPEANLSAVDPSENIREALEIDSFDFLNLLIALHEQLHVEIPEADYAKVQSLSELEAYLVEKIACPS